jgi:hypothetical protein
MGRHIVDVRGKEVEISVHQKSKTVWVAGGEYLGKRYESKGRNENDAAKNWREVAGYHYLGTGEEPLAGASEDLRRTIEAIFSELNAQRADIDRALEKLREHGAILNQVQELTTLLFEKIDQLSEPRRRDAAR